jgi:hypothetical protein
MSGLGHLVATICANDSEQAIWPPGGDAGLPVRRPPDIYRTKASGAPPAGTTLWPPGPSDKIRHQRPEGQARQEGNRLVNNP